MRYSRGGIIAVLIAVEIFIAGAILWALSGEGFTANAASGLHRVDQAEKAFAAIDAGSAPHVVVDDANSGVGITASTDGLVHVTDASRAEGWTWGSSSRPPLHVTRTADGVLIQRAQGGDFGLIFGFDREHIDVAVPAAALLDVRQCSGADVSGLTGQVRIHSVDGHIAANGVHANALTLSSNDGSLRLDDVSAPTIDASTNDGSIRARRLQVGGGTMHTDDGSVRLQLLTTNVTVRARTSDGSVYFNGSKTAGSDSDEAAGEFQVGSGGSPLQVSTQDGSIHITTNGAI